jgi:hypothetical protein
VPMSTLQHNKRQGGWGIIDIGTKCQALIHHHLQTLHKIQESTTAVWSRKWKLHMPNHNPPQIQLISAEMDYMCHFAMDTAYIPTQQEFESRTKFKCRIYATMVLLLRETTTLPAMRVILLWPPTDWNLVWTKLHETPAPENIKMEWYRVVHDIIPTNDQLQRINMTTTTNAVNATHKIYCDTVSMRRGTTNVGLDTGKNCGNTKDKR